MKYLYEVESFVSIKEICHLQSSKLCFISLIICFSVRSNNFSYRFHIIFIKDVLFCT
jgi:hypothetical protein